MRIGINGKYLEQQRTSVARHLTNVMKCWIRNYEHNIYYVYFNELIPKDVLPDHPAIVKELVHSAFLKWTPLWENIVLKNRVSRHKEIDLFFSPSSILPFRLKIKRQVVHIYDVINLTHPEWNPWNSRATYYRLLAARTAKQASLVIAGSIHTKKDILSSMQIPENKIKVIYSGSDEKFRPLKDENKLKKIKTKYGIDGDYILYVGFILNRRNVDTLINAFDRFVKKEKQPLELIIVGENRTYPYIDIERLILDLKLENQVKLIGHIDDYGKGAEDLLLLYNGALAFFYPSSYEGFGIPPLEAMACGTPVVTSNLTSLPEVVGDAAWLLNDPSDVDEMVFALENVLCDSDLRQKMRVRGLEQAKKFSWEKCAEETMRAFEGVYAS